MLAAGRGAHRRPIAVSRDAASDSDAPVLSGSRAWRGSAPSNKNSSGSESSWAISGWFSAAT
jgi:hypothetical protein